MPRIKPLTAEARMDQQLLAAIDKYKRLAGIKRYGDLGPRMGRCAATANSGLALLGTIIEWRENRKAKQREHQLHNLNRREEFHRRHASYLAQMQEMLESVEGRKGA